MFNTFSKKFLTFWEKTRLEERCFWQEIDCGSGSWRDRARKYRIELNFEPLINLAFILCRVEELFEALKEFSAVGPRRSEFLLIQNVLILKVFGYKSGIKSIKTPLEFFSFYREFCQNWGFWVFLNRRKVPSRWWFFLFFLTFRFLTVCVEKAWCK